MRRFIYCLGFMVCFLGLKESPIHAQWQVQTTLTGRPALLSVKAVSKDIAWTCSGNGTVYRTIDGGKTWSPTPRVTSTEAVGCIEALDSTTAFVGGAGPGFSGGNAQIYRTTNGGQSWQIVYVGTGIKTAWDAIQFFDSHNGIAVSDPDIDDGNFLIVKTTDGGTTWSPVSNPPDANASEFGIVNCLYFYDGLNGWFGTGPSDPNGIAGRIFRTTDGGNTWVGFASGNTAPVFGVRFISPLIGIRTSSALPFLTRSIDGGQTWTGVTNLPLTNILRMNATTGVNTRNFNQLWISGRTNAPFILSSIDGGTTWQQQAIVNAVENSIFHISAVSFGAMNDSVQAWGVTLNQNTFATGGEILSYRQRIGFITGVKEQVNIPTEYTLSQNYPNPFNPETTIAYQLPRAGQVKLLVYNLAGQLVRTLIDAPQAAGRFQINWDGKDDAGNGVASGVYLYRLEAESFAETKKMILMR